MHIRSIGRTAMLIAAVSSTAATSALPAPSAVRLPTSAERPAGGATARHHPSVAGTMRDLGTLGGDYSDASSINDRGSVAGTSAMPDAQQGDPGNVFLWSRGHLRDLGDGQPAALNQRDEVAGNVCFRFCHGFLRSANGPIELGVVESCDLEQGMWSRDLNDRSQLLMACQVPQPVVPGSGIHSSVIHSFVWFQGRFTTVGPLGASGSNGHDLNNAGEVAGGTLVGDTQHAFLWSSGILRDLGTLGGRSSEATALNDRGDVTGASDTAEGERHAFLWSRGTMWDLGTLGGAYSEGVAVNAGGQVIGWSITEDGSGHAFLWHHGRMYDLGTLGGPNSWPTAINDHGEVVGTSETADGHQHAFLWRQGRMFDLGTLGGGESGAADINGRGQVVGVAERADGRTHAFVWTPAGHRGS